MEAIPKLPMISFQAKLSPDNNDINAKLKALISERFGENPSAFANEIKEFETLRANTCIRASETIEGVAALKKYYCQVVFLKNRFKISSVMAFPFSWNELFSQSNFASTDIDYELASVLYNIGALHSRLGATESRDEAEGMKMAVAHFQCAAWAFHSLPDLYAQDIESDLNGDLMGIISQISLAQAQECIMEKSILDNRKPTIISKVGGQVVEYYKQAIKSIEHSNSKEHGDRIIDFIGNKQQNQWAALIKFKIKYYASLSLLHMGMLSEENQKMGERVSYYQAAGDALAEAAKLAKKLDSIHKNVAEPLMYASDVINGKLDNAKKENEFIYHEKVPDIDTLPEIKGASLVKGIPFDVSDPEVSGQDIFHRLVPLEAHEASSLYSEEQAKLLRTILSETESANNELTVYMSALQLEDIPSEEEYANIPQQLIECAAGLSLRTTAVSQLQEGMASLAGVSADVEASIIEIQKLLTEEKNKEKQFQEIVGPRPSHIISELEKETQKYQEAHSMASESNLTLNKAMRLHVKNLQLLSKPLSEIEAQIPQVSSLDQSVLHSLTSIKEIISKVEEMRGQRQHLLDNLREAIKNDDITNSLASKGNKDNEKVFEEELKKHQATIDYIRQNIRAQNNILAALTEKNAEYAIAREKVGTFVRERNEMIGGLVASFHVYEDLLDKTTKGLEFYTRLEQNVSKLSSRVEGVVKVQEEEREQLISTSTKKMAEAREKSLALISGQQQSIPSAASSIQKPPSLSIPDYKPEFAPGAPPPDTPENPPIGAPSIINKPATSGRPKLKDYLAARKEGSKEEKDQLPGVRPPPVGSEAEPDNTTHSAAAISLAGYQGQYPGMQGHHTTMQFPGMPGQYAGMPSYPGMAYPPTFYQNPQFAAMYAQSLNMVKGLQGGANPVSTSGSYAPGPSVSTTTTQPTTNTCQAQNTNVSPPQQNSQQQDPNIQQLPGQNLQQQQGQNSQQHQGQFIQQGQNMQQQQGQNMQQQQGQNSQHQTGQNTQQQQGQNIQQQQGQNSQHQTGQNTQHQTGQNTHQQQSQNIQQQQKPSVQLQGQNVQPQQSHNFGQNFQHFQGQNLQQYQSYQLQQTQGQQTQMPPNQQTQMSAGHQSQLPAATSQQQPSYQILQQQQSQISQSTQATPSTGSAVKTTAGQQIQPIYSSGYTMPYSPVNVTQSYQPNPTNVLPQHIHKQQAYSYLNQQPVSGSPTVGNQAQFQQQTQQFYLNNQNYMNYHSSPQHRAPNTNNGLVGQPKMNPVVPQPGSIQHQDGMLQQGQFNTNNNTSVSTVQNPTNVTNSYITGVNFSNPSTTMANTYGMTQKSQGQISLTQIYGQQGQIYQQRTGQNQVGMASVQQINPGQPGFVGLLPGQVRQQVPGTVPQQMTTQSSLQQPGQVFQQMPGQVSSHFPGQNSQQMHGQVRTQAPGNFIQQTSSKVGQQMPGQVVQQMPGQVGQQMPGQMGQQMPGQVGQQMPGQVGQQMPGQVGQQMPQQVGQQMPGQMGQRMLGQMGQRMPGQMGQQMPGQIGQQMPGQIGQQMVGQKGQQIPGQVGQHMPRQIGQQMPGQVGQQMSGQVGQQMSGQVGQQMSGQVGQQMSGQVGQQMSNQMSQQMPGQVGQQLFSQVNQQRPGQVVQQMPGQMGQQIPGQMGQQIPGQVGKQIPGQMGQQIPGQVGKQIPGQVGKQIPGQVGQQIPGQVGQHLPGQVGQQIPGQIGHQLSGQVGQQMPGQVHQQPPSGQTHLQENKDINPRSAIDSDTKPGSNLDLLSGLNIEGNRSVSQLSSSTITGISSTNPPQQENGVINLSSGNKKIQDPEIQSYVSKEKLKEEKMKLDSMLSTLDIQTTWKQILESVEKNVAIKKLSVSVARCYPTKNRSSDVLPYDQSRVALLNSKDDYINASSIKSLTPGCGDLIVTQLPVRAYLCELLKLVWQEGIETMVSLVPQQDMADSAYLPLAKQSLAVEEFTITCQSLKECSGYRERVFNICCSLTRQTRAILHIEMTGWSGPDLPPVDRVQQLLLPGVLRVLALRKLQRYPGKPVLVHCKDGGSKSGTVCLILAALAQLQVTSTLPDTVSIFSNILQTRKGVIRDKVYVRFYLSVVEQYMCSELGLLNNSGLKADPINAPIALEPSLSSTSVPIIYGEQGQTIVSSIQSEQAVLDQAKQEIQAPVVQNIGAGDISIQPGVEQNIQVEFVDDNNVEANDDDNIPVTITEEVDAGNGNIIGGQSSQQNFSKVEELTRFEGLSLTDSPAKRRISKEDFKKSTTSLGSSSGDPSDPLSQLDPLWSLGKK